MRDLASRPFRIHKNETEPNGSILFWWTRADSNRLPSDCKSDVLPGELRARLSPEADPAEADQIAKEYGDNTKDNVSRIGPARTQITLGPTDLKPNHLGYLFVVDDKEDSPEHTYKKQ